MSRPGPDRPRDRDAVGRPRNARPRDGLGRPLPYDAVGVERAPEGVRRSPAQTIRQAQQLLEDGKPFHAHEVFEDAWKSAAEPERSLWKGLAQLAVAITHAARGNATGGSTLLRRGARAIQPYLGDDPYGIDVAAVTRWAVQSADDLDAGIGPISTPSLLGSS